MDGARGGLGADTSGGRCGIITARTGDRVGVGDAVQHMSESAEGTERPGSGPELPPVALDLPDTADGLRRYRRKAVFAVNASAAMLAAAVTLIVLSSRNEGLAATLAPPLVGLGLSVLVMGVLIRIRSRRMRRVLGSAPWVAHASVATPLGSGAAAVVLAGGPEGDELLVLAPRTVQWRYHLVSGPEGVLWWCGDARTGGVLAPPGGREVIWARPLGARKSRRILARPQVRNLPHRAVPEQPQPWPANADVNAGTGPTGHHFDQSSSADLAKRKRRPWWRGTFRYVLLVGFVAVALATVWSDQTDSDPQIDLTVISEQSDGTCVVRWTGPFDGRQHTGPYHCDPHRDPVLDDWESGFVVSSGPWKGDLYDYELRGTPTFSAIDTLGVGGLLLFLAGIVGGGVRVSRAARARRTRDREGTSYVRRSGAPVLRPTAREPGPPATLRYATFAAEGERQAGQRGPDPSMRRPNTDVRVAPWWRVRALLKISRILKAAIPLLYALGIGLGSWLWPGTFAGYIQIFAVASGLAGLVALHHALRDGIPYARRLSRHALAPYREVKRYVLLYELSGTGTDPLLLLFSADAGDDTPPEALLRLVAPGPDRHPWRGLPAPVGTAELRGRLDDPPLVVAWIDNRPYWPLEGYEELDLTVLETRRVLEDLLTARA